MVRHSFIHSVHVSLKLICVVYDHVGAFCKRCLDSLLHTLSRFNTVSLVLCPWYCFRAIILHFESSFFSHELSEVGGLQSTSGLMPRTGPVHTDRP